MTEEINEIIKKNLPAQVGDVLKEKLEQADIDANSLKLLRSTYQERVKEISELKNLIDDYKKFDSRNELLESREKAVAEKERLAEVTELKTKLEESNKRADIVIEFTKGLVRNTSFRKTVFDSENQTAYQGNNGMWVQPTPIHKDLTETKEAQ